MENEISTMSNVNAPELLSFKELNDLIPMMNPSEPRITYIHQNLSEKKMELFMNNTKAESEIFNQRINLYGIPVIKKSYVPKDEMWFVDQNGQVLKRFKFS